VLLSARSEHHRLPIRQQCAELGWFSAVVIAIE
jgi:hypothetical protein